MDTGASDDLDGQLVDLLEGGRVSELREWHEMGVETARRVEDEVFSAGEGPEMSAVAHHEIEGPAGPLRLRSYRPSAADSVPPPVIVFCHGGGWVLGTLDSADDLCRELAARTRAVVVSVDYRLAPEDPFPAAVEDAWAALSWTRSNVGEVGGDPDRVAIAGTSAGGGLAAAVALRSREAGLGLSAQLLCYPMLDRYLERRSYQDHADAPLLTRADVEWFWEQYLDGPEDDVDPLAAPLRASSLDGVAPAVVATAGHDVLRSEGVAYAERLAAAGVDTVHCHYPSLAHGFLSLTDDVDRADAAMAEVTAAVGRLLG